MVKIDFQMRTIPVEIGEVRLEFLATRQNMNRFVQLINNLDDLEKEFDEKLKIEYEKLAKNDLSAEERFGRETELQVKEARESYDIFFGEGAFDRLFKVYPDAHGLLYTVFPQIFEPLSGEIIKCLEADAKLQETTKNEYLKKLKKKKAKKK